MQNGRILRDKLGLDILECSRGTKDVENCHKYTARIARPSVMGFELCDAIMSEFQHRANQRASQRRRPGFPDVGRYDSWLVDALHNIIEETNGALYCSGWANASDYMNTDETFGVVPVRECYIQRWFLTFNEEALNSTTACPMMRQCVMPLFFGSSGMFRPLNLTNRLVRADIGNYPLEESLCIDHNRYTTFVTLQTQSQLNSTFTTMLLLKRHVHCS
jgi:hypothetical protein